MGQPGEREMLVLLVEDEPDLLEVFQEMLEEEHCLVIPARDGARALRLLRVIKPEVIVTDLMMPELDGLSLLREYAKLPPPRAPVIAMSAFRPYLDESRKLGAAATLSKPLLFEHLMQTIHALTAGRPPAAEEIPRTLASDEEARRLQAVLELRLDQPAPEPALAAYLEKVAHHFGVPICLLSVITQDQQFWTASCGLPEDYGKGGPRGESFCTHAVAARAALVIQDALENPFFRANPFVTTRGLRFYAGVPLIARHGEPVGTLCILDSKPRRFTYFDLELLTLFSHGVLSSLEWRERGMHPDIPESAFRYLQHIDQELDIFGKSLFSDLAVVEGARAAEFHQHAICAALAVPARRLSETVRRLKERPEGGIIGRLGHSRLGWLVADSSVENVRAAALDAAGHQHAFVEAVQLDHFAGAIRTGLQQMEIALGDAGLV